MRDRIDINKDLIPYSFDILLGDESFELAINYNESADLFTVMLSKDDVIMCNAEPIVYGVPLFIDIYEEEGYPAIDIIPLDESGHEDIVTYENFNKTVFLTIDNEGE